MPADNTAERRAESEATVGHQVMELVQMPDGSIATRADVKKWQDEGYQMSKGPHKA